MTYEHPDYEVKFVDTFLKELEVQKEDFTDRILGEIAQISLTPYEKEYRRKQVEKAERGEDLRP